MNIDTTSLIIGLSVGGVLGFIFGAVTAFTVMRQTFVESLQHLDKYLKDKNK